MKTLWIYAHPEPRSLNGSLRDEGVRTLRGLGHEVRESDLYAMNWRPVVAEDDFPGREAGRLWVGDAQQTAYAEGSLSPDILAEQEKVRWADTIVIQFPLWWFGMPAILKGWFDRVFLQGFAFGLANPATGRQRRYGDNALSGKRALVVTTFGARESSMGPRGIHGAIDDLLFPLQHGILWYAGIAALPPLAIDGANRMSDDEYELAAKRLRERLRNLPEQAAVPFRYQDHGDYDAELVLRPELAPGRTGLDIHLDYSRADGDLGDHR